MAVEGTEQTVSLAVQVSSIPIAELGVFSFRLAVDDEPDTRLPFRLFKPAQPTFGFPQEKSA